MKYVYLSPHLDDAIYSCGGLIWQQGQEGHQVEVWTICAGDPPKGPLSELAHSLHKRWDVGLNPVAIRRQEDIIACRLLGINYLHFDVPDSIYRLEPNLKVPIYDSERAIFGDIKSSDYPLIDEISNKIRSELSSDMIIISPLSIGNHVDHQLIRQVAEMLSDKLIYYADFPYVVNMQEDGNNSFFKKLAPIYHQISNEAVDAWRDGIITYKSQISTFWEDKDKLKQQIESFVEKNNGVILWKTK